MAIFKIIIYGIMATFAIVNDIDKMLIGLILLYWILSELILINDKIKDSDK